MTTLPATNNLWIILLIGGILMSGYGISKLNEFENFNLNEDLKSTELSLKIDHIAGISNEINKNNKLIDSLILSPEKFNKKINAIIDVNNILIEKYNTESLNLKEKVHLHSAEFKIKSKIHTKDLTENLMVIIFGLFIFIMGIVNIMKGQVYRDKILYSEYLDLSIKQPNCQSCGMDLIYDLSFDKKSNYCSYCFDGKNFRNKEITLNDFKALVEIQLKTKGYKASEIKLHLKKINNLIRWRKKFDWKS